MNDDLKLVRGSGNVFRDFGRANTDLEQARAILAGKIIGILDERKLTVRAAEEVTRVAEKRLTMFLLCSIKLCAPAAADIVAQSQGLVRGGGSRSRGDARNLSVKLWEGRD